MLDPETILLRNVPGDFPGGLWLRLRATNTAGAGSIPGRGVKIAHAVQYGQKIKKKKSSKKFCGLKKSFLTQASKWPRTTATRGMS